MANPSPHVNFHRMLGLGFVPRFLSFLITARPPVHFNLHCGFIRVYDILEVQALVFACPCQSFFFICVSYNLTVTFPLEVQPNWFLHLKAVLALTTMPSFARTFWSSIPVDSSSFVICWSIICFAFVDIFEAWPLPGLHERVLVSWYCFRNL